MPLDLKEKVCIDCKKTFKPTSNVQKRCPPCIEIHKHEPKHEPKSPGPSKLKTKPIPPTSTDIDDSLVLRMLVAAGLVTEEKIQSAREIVRKLKA